MDARLPAQIEVSALLRQVEIAGGFGTVLHRGQAESGAILVICADRARDRKAYERIPDAHGPRRWSLVRAEGNEQNQEFDNYCQRRAAQDPDLWIIELDIANPERFIGLAKM